ncbi:MAG: glycosyltransferase, partial [Xanthomonadales bacterium]|nr:glycosyltransferase [Xanthomonadales bacterium]
ASAVGGNVEIIRDGENGRLVGLGDDAALEDALNALLDDGELRARLGRAAATWVAAHASIEVMREAYERFYAEASCSRK